LDYNIKQQFLKGIGGKRISGDIIDEEDEEEIQNQGIIEEEPKEEREYESDEATNQDTNKKSS
jgi:hypothetical protein